MNIKNLLIPRLAITSLPDNRLKGTIILLNLVFFISIIIFAELSGFGPSGIIKETFKNAGWPSTLTPELWFQLFIIIRDSILFLLLLVVLYFSLLALFSWIIKKIFSLFKRKITVFKLININFYSILYSNIIGLVISIFCLPLALLAKINSNFILDSRLLLLVLLTSILLLNAYVWLFPLIIYIYGIKISLKKYE
jgi:hypothetical protein